MTSLKVVHVPILGHFYRNKSFTSNFWNYLKKIALCLVVSVAGMPSYLTVVHVTNHCPRVAFVAIIPLVYVCKQIYLRFQLCC